VEFPIHFCLVYVIVFVKSAQNIVFFRIKFFRSAAEVDIRGSHFQLVLCDSKRQVFTC
jgi:hypothetical protein